MTVSSKNTDLAEPARTIRHRQRVSERVEELRKMLRSLFPTEKSIVLEIGCGHGHFLNAYAAAHPDSFCVGIDIVRDRIERATRKRNRSRLPNLIFLLAEAHEFLGALPETVHLATIYVLFPDPWPKRRHHKNRLLQPAFLSLLAEKSQRDARIHFRTDFEPYFLESAEVVKTHRGWERTEEAWPFEMETVFQARAADYFSLTAKKRA